MGGVSDYDCMEEVYAVGENKRQFMVGVCVLIRASLEPGD